jgi:hypothetical protein
MPVFERHMVLGSDRIAFEAKYLVMAGWTGRDPAAVQHHVDELGVLGVARPRACLCSTAWTRRCSPGRSPPSRCWARAPRARSRRCWWRSPTGSGSASGSDHTDRAVEAHGVAISKQLCRKPMAGDLWRFDEVIGHWDELVLRAHIVEDGERRLYMEAALAAVRRPEDLIAACALELGLAKGAPLPIGSVMFMGAIGAIGGIRPAPGSRWRSPTRCSAARSATPTTSAPCRS